MPTVDKPSPVPTAVSALTNLRKRMLDLTGRNRLINYRHTRGNSLRIIDERPNLLAKHLLGDGQMRFLAVPEPSEQQLIEQGYLQYNQESGDLERLKRDPGAEEWARVLGLNTDYDLPCADSNTDTDTTEEPARHTDRYIQTALYPHELETRLNSLYQKSNSAIEEMGANILYLAFGFLEWYESSSSDTARIAPLYLLPAQLHKGKLNPATRTYEYTLSYSGEDLIPNLSLREKLKLDFALALPELDENTEPEDYFTQVESMFAPHLKHWRIRRFGTLTLLNFSKLLMYLDLDPARWPEDRCITDHPVVSRFLTGYNGEQPPATDASLSFAEEHSVDDLADVHQHYPLIDDADSSQHSALIDAVDGHNLVIEGPPGTGKSQTITNLIAAAISQGKRVLFVAEKLAALEVVHNRLARAGLSDFCLELHSHKSSKRQVLDDIVARLKKRGRYRNPQELATEIARCETVKEQLRQHAERINQPWGQTGQTPHQILTGATRYRSSLPLPPEQLHPQSIDSSSATPERQRLLADQTSTFASVYSAIAEQLEGEQAIQTHPWYGVHNTDLQVFDGNQVSDLLQQWQQALQALQSSLPQTRALLQTDTAADLEQLSGLRALQQQLANIPALSGNELLAPLARLHGDTLREAKLGEQLYQQIRADQDWLVERAGRAFLSAEHDLPTLAAAARTLRTTVNGSTTLAQLAEALHRLQALQGQLAQPAQIAGDIRSLLPAQAGELLNCSPDGLRGLMTFIRLAAEPDAEARTLCGPLFDNELLDSLLPRLTSELERLDAVRQRLSHTLRLADLPDARQIRAIALSLASGGLLRWLKADWRTARKQALALAVSPQTALADIQPLLDELADYSEAVIQLQHNSQYQAALGHHFQGLATPVALLNRLRDWYARVRSEYGIGFGSRVALGEAIFALSANQARAIRSLAEHKVPEQLQSLLDELAALQQVFTGASTLHSPHIDLMVDPSPLATLRADLSTAISHCHSLATQNELTIAQLSERIERLTTMQNNLTRWHSADLDRRLFAGQLGLSTDIDSDNSAARTRLHDTLTLASTLETEITDSRLTDLIRQQPDSQTFAALHKLADQLHTGLAAESAHRDAFASRVGLVHNEWIADHADQLATCLSRNQHALDNPAALQSWLGYARERDHMSAQGLAGIAAAVEQGDIPVADAVDAWHAGLYDLLARELLQAEPELARFSGHSQSALQQQFAHYDNRLKALQCERIAWQADQIPVPAGNASGRVSQYTELALIQHECNKKTRHIPIRQLMERAGEALVSIKPCFMMGPMAVAQYLAPGAMEFDIVVMDEASQIKPEDALGALARGKQLVVVGDPKQLPPTSFFDRMVEDQEDDPTALETSESILDATLPIFRARRLRWHYRSQHESLIAFSNQAFYDSDLVLFPSPHKASNDHGVHFTRVPMGTFVNRRNIEESRIIAEAICHHLTTRPEESLGVVAMSAEQREQVERALDALVKDNTHYRDALENDAGKAEPLFIKNLENVQGDERDVIFISMTYGPQEPGGRVMQRFGPINTDTGWRRLNVLLTRSRRRMHIFSSMGASDIQVGPGSRLGIQALRDFLGYCETGILHRTEHHSGRAPDSHFEIAVMQRLRQAGFNCVPQVGVAGFYIDLAVVDPANPGRYLMGIECDGATYHSAKSVRDRDRLRQAVLERLGWNIRRIWSTDWFKNPDGELLPIIRELQQLRRASPAPSVDEVAAIDRIVRTETEQAAAYAHPPAQGSSLQQQLTDFDTRIIRPACPDTPAGKQLLRPAMLDALSEFKPTSKTEFLELIPAYIREATDPAEARYLDQVFDLINASQNEETA